MSNALNRLAALSVVLVVLVLAMVISLDAYAENANCSLKFIILGRPSCPHCRAVNITLNSLFPGCVAFYNIELNVTASALYTKLWDLVIRNPFYAVPFVVVVYKDRPIAFIVGERPREWWSSLAENLTKNPPDTAIVCYSVKCSKLPRDVYVDVLRVYYYPPEVKFAIIACGGINSSLLASMGLRAKCNNTLNSSVISDALSLLGVTNVTVNYLVICSQRPVLLLFSKDVPRLLVRENRTTIDVYRIATSIAINFATAEGAKNPLIVYVYMNNSKPVVMIKTVPTNISLASVLLDMCSQVALLGEQTKDIAKLVGMLIGLALIDAINPCFIALYAALVATTMSASGFGAALRIGLLIALGVYTGYFLLGLGVSQALALIGAPLRILLAIIMILLGVRGLTAYWRKTSYECKICKSIEGIRLGLLGFYGFGLLASWTLLPCTAGPYVAAITLMHGLSLSQRLTLLALYNLIFISPLVAILIGSTRLAEKYKAIAPKMEAIAGVILVLLGVLVVLEQLRIIPPII